MLWSGAQQLSAAETQTPCHCMSCDAPIAPDRLHLYALAMWSMEKQWWEYWAAGAGDEGEDSGPVRWHVRAHAIKICFPASLTCHHMPLKHVI